jgi:hypothetical protein
METVSDLYRFITNKDGGHTAKAAPNGIYDEIMSKENRAIRLMNRTVKDQTRRRSTKFVDTPLSMIPVLLLKTLNDITNDFLRIEEYTPFHIAHILTKGQRPIFLGILFLIVGGYMTLIHLSDS